MRMVAVILAGMALAGCQTKSYEELSFSEREALAGEIVKRCVAQGVKANDPRMPACLQAEVQRDAAMRRNNRLRQQAFAEGLGEIGDAYNRQAQNRVSCTSNRIGDTVTTNCY